MQKDIKYLLVLTAFAVWALFVICIKSCDLPADRVEKLLISGKITCDSLWPIRDIGIPAEEMYAYDEATRETFSIGIYKSRRGLFVVYCIGNKLYAAVSSDNAKREVKWYCRDSDLLDRCKALMLPRQLPLY